MKRQIRALKEMITERGLHTLVEVDGGVKPGNAREVASAGADILVMGSAFFDAGDYGALVKQMRGLLGRV